MKQEIIDYIDSNQEFSTFCQSIKTMNDLLNNDTARYFMLATIVSSDAIYNLATAKEAQEKLNFVVDNMKFFNVSDKIKNEIKEFSDKAQEIITQEIENYSNKNTEA